jgi:hypothetical protein
VGLLSVPFCSFGYCCYETVWHSAVLGIAVFETVWDLHTETELEMCCKHQVSRKATEKPWKKERVEFQKSCMARSGGVNSYG